MVAMQASGTSGAFCNARSVIECDDAMSGGSLELLFVSPVPHKSAENS